jgi:hypothetical protein
MSDVVKWMSDNIPKAIETLKGFWENTLLPAIKAVWAFIQDPLIPIFEKVVGWLQDNIPTAISTLAGFWENTLKPAIETVWKFINDPLIPIFEKLWDWLETTIPAAIQTLTDFWTNTLLPAITDVWKFINDPLMPLFKALADFFDAAFTLAVTAMAGLWENVLEPAIKGVWKVIDEKVMPILRDVAEFLGGKLSDAFNTIKDKVLGPAQEKFEKVGGAIGGISGAIDTVIGWIGRMADKLSNIKLPGWLTPGSPTPFEIGLRGIGDALSEVVPWMRGLDKAIPDSADLGDSASGFAKLAQSIASLVGSFSGISGGIASGSVGNLDGVAAYVTDHVVPVTKALHRAFKYDLPKLMDESVVTSMKMWADRMGSIASILKSMAQIPKDLADGYKTMQDMYEVTDPLDSQMGDIIGLMRNLHRIFKYELPKLMDESVVTSLKMWADRIGSIASILSSMVKIPKDLADGYQALEDMYEVTDPLDSLMGDIIGLVKHLHRIFKYELPKLMDESVTDSLGMWADRMGSVASVLDSMTKIPKSLSNGYQALKDMYEVTDPLDSLMGDIVGLVKHLHRILSMNCRSSWTKPSPRVLLCGLIEWAVLQAS